MKKQVYTAPLVSVIELETAPVLSAVSIVSGGTASGDDAMSKTSGDWTIWGNDGATDAE